MKMTSACLCTLKESEARPIRKCVGCKLFYKDFRIFVGKVDKVVSEQVLLWVATEKSEA